MRKKVTYDKSSENQKDNEPIRGTDSNTSERTSMARQPVTYNASTKGNNSDSRINVVNIIFPSFTFEFNGNRFEIRAWHVIAFLIMLGGSAAVIIR